MERLSFLSIILTIFLVSACSSDQAKLAKKRSELYFASGTQSLLVKDYTEALKNLLEANKLDPENDEIITNLAMAYYFKGEKDLALKELNHALSINENNSDARINIASIYSAEGKYQEAEELYHRVLKDLTYDKQARTYLNLALVALKFRQDSVQAEKYLTKALQEDENYCPAHYQLGLIRYKQRKFKKALESFKDSMMGTCQKTPASMFYVGSCYQELKNYDLAKSFYRDLSLQFAKSPFSSKAKSKLMSLDDSLIIHNAQQVKNVSGETPEF